jgi:hypothetical protein
MKTEKFPNMTFKCFSVNDMSKIEKYWQDNDTDDDKLFDFIVRTTLKEINGEEVDDKDTINIEFSGKEKEVFWENTVKLNFYDRREILNDEKWIDLFRECIIKQKEKNIKLIAKMQEALSFSLPNFNEILKPEFERLGELSRNIPDFNYASQIRPEILMKPEITMQKTMIQYLEELSERINKQNELVSYANNISMDAMNKNIKMQENSNIEARRQSRNAFLFSIFSIILALISIIAPLILDNYNHRQEEKSTASLMQILDIYKINQEEAIKVQEDSNKKSDQIMLLLEELIKKEYVVNVLPNVNM